MFRILLSALTGLIVFSLQAKDIPVHPSRITRGTFWGVSRPLRDIPPMTAEEYRQMEIKARTRNLNKDLGTRLYPFQSTALPKGSDPLWQKQMGTNDFSQGPTVNFEGQTSPYYPPDCNGTSGPNHFMQTINTTYAIYDKAGNILAGPTAMNLIFGSVPGANRNDGDPIILYDEMADKWVVTEFSIPNSGTNYVLMAVSTTNDPTGTYYQYSFPVDKMPDYPKFSVWRDGYYMGDNNASTKDIYVFERGQIITGGAAPQMVGFNNPWRPTSVDGFMCVPPIDNDGPSSPVGTPGMFIAFNDDGLAGGTDQLWLYNLAVDWTNPSASTFVRSQQIDVEPFNCNFGNNWNNIEQKGVTQRVDGIPQVIMNVPQYRNFGTYQTIVCCHTVNMDGVRHAGIRWYELRKTTGDWQVRQQGTYAPDLHSRWMGSVALNGSNEIALGYSISSTSEYPGIRYAGQSAAAYAAANGILDIEEDTIVVGTNSQTGANRWGDYAQISVDPSDDKTFWFTTQYIGSGGSRKTRIASFKYTSTPVVATVLADSITYSSANLKGVVNPTGLETQYHFEWGLHANELTNSTAVVSAGAGMESVTVNAGITGLLPETTYFYRIVGTSLGGTAQGIVLRFTTGMAPYLSVTPPARNVAADAGTTSFDVSSNVDWNVSSDADWCTATMSGSGNDTIAVQFGENLSIDSRVAHLTVSGLSVGNQIVTVIQEGAQPFLFVTPGIQNVTDPSGETDFAVNSNTSWTAVSDKEWCVVTQSGSGVGTIKATIAANISVESRSCTILVSAPGTTGQSVTVVQAGAQARLAVTPQNQNVTAVAGNSSFAVSSNFPWVVESNAAWCVVTSSGGLDGSVTAQYTQNLSDQARIATIKVGPASALPSTLPTQEVTLTQAKSSIGIDEIAANDIQLFPNPATDYVTIKTGASINGAVKVTIQNTHGKTVMTETFDSQREHSVNVSKLSADTYFITVTSGNLTVTKKLAVVR